MPMCVGAHSVVSNSLVTPWTTACQSSLSVEFFRQEYWSGLPFLLQNEGMELDQTQYLGKHSRLT